MKNNFIVKDSKAVVLGKVIEFHKKEIGLNLTDKEIEKQLNKNDYDLFLSYDKELWIIFLFKLDENIYYAFNLTNKDEINDKNKDNLKLNINNFKKTAIDSINHFLENALIDDSMLIRALKNIENL